MFNSLINLSDTNHVVPSSTLYINFLRYFTRTFLLCQTPLSLLCPAVFQHFELFSFSLPSDIVKQLRPANCRLERIPVCLFKEVFNNVGSSILTLVNSSLNTECVPSAFKHAVVQPLLKKKNLDPSVLSNFRQISKLPF